MVEGGEGSAGTAAWRGGYDRDHDEWRARMKYTLLCTLAIVLLAGCGDRNERGASGETRPGAARTDSLAVAPIDVPDGADLAVTERGVGEVSGPVDTAEASADEATVRETAAGLDPVEGPRGTAGPGTPAPAPPPAPTPDVSGEAERILASAEQAYESLRSMRAEFVQTVDVPLLGSTQRSRGTIFHRSPDRFMMRFAEPEGDVILADGQYVWMYHPSIDPGQVTRGRLAAGGQHVDLQREFLSDANRRFDVVRTGGETIGGRQTHALTLTPRQSSPYREVRLWVDAEDHLVRRFEITERNESVRTLEMSDLRPNAALDDDVFRWSPPAGAQVYDIQ